MFQIGLQTISDKLPYGGSIKLLSSLSQSSDTPPPTPALLTPGTLLSSSATTEILVSKTRARITNNLQANLKAKDQDPELAIRKTKNFELRSKAQNKQ